MTWIISLLTLTILEIVLGIDNIVFLTLVTNELHANLQKKARRIGLSLAMITRVLLLLSLSALMKLTFTVINPAEWVGITDKTIHDCLALSWKDLILIAGGCFLIYNSTKEIHEKLEGDEHKKQHKKYKSFTYTIIQILLLDIVFSLDSVITAIGMAKLVWVMIAAVIIAVLIMLWASETISRFVNKHASVKMLALAFLMLIGVSLVAEGFDQEIPKGYIYFGMAFSIIVEMLNLRSKHKTVKNNKQ
jgi:predicted tellurium resistance membrane protein TerC